MERRKSSTPHYQTFPTPPPKSRGRPPSQASSTVQDSSTDLQQNGEESSSENGQSKLPTKQLAMLAVIALCEQTALNSISPYLPEMTSSFPEVDSSQVGVYVGTIASSFAFAQLATNFFWGWLSDQIGRKPVILLGASLTAACFVAFGFCKTLAQAIAVQALMGLVNGNQGVISTCLGEITDRSNQSKAFVYLPVVYGIGGITGPALGGMFVFKENPFKKGQQNPYPYLFPNLFSALILAVEVVLAAIFLKESLEESKDLPPLRKRVDNLFAWIWQFMGGAHHPTYLRRSFICRDSVHRTGAGTDAHSYDSATDNESESQTLLSDNEVYSSDSQDLTGRKIFTRNTVLLLGTYLVFQLSNISFHTLYPIFAYTPEPIGRDISHEAIGMSLSFAGIVTIVFQVAIFGKLKEKMGNKRTYRAGLFLFFVSMILMPWVGYKDSKPPFGLGSGTLWLWIEIGFILLVKTVAGVGGLTSALLLVCFTANHDMNMKDANEVCRLLIRRRTMPS
jgi:MFS family permease